MFAEFLAIRAIGFITTKNPDGSPGFSLLIILSVEFGTGIQLGFGFTLIAVGGLRRPQPDDGPAGADARACAPAPSSR